jgi:hypothetical protein
MSFPFVSVSMCDLLNILVDESKKRATFERQMKQMNMHGDVPFNPAQVKANNKYEYPFLGKDE